MIVVFLALGTTDLLFALDSIPAIFGLTQEPFIVFTANVFALMGLRQLYFLLGGLLKRLVYLSLGLAVILAFIGVKLVIEALHENELPFINGGEHDRGGPGDPDLAVADRHPRRPGDRHRRQPAEDPRVAPDDAPAHRLQPRPAARSTVPRRGEPRPVPHRGGTVPASTVAPPAATSSPSRHTSRTRSASPVRSPASPSSTTTSARLPGSRLPACVGDAEQLGRASVVACQACSGRHAAVGHERRARPGWTRAARRRCRCPSRP